jgi:hypothetical protein
MKQYLVAAALMICGAGLTWASPLSAEPKQTGGTVGGVCHVVAGDNKGKTGTYDSDGDCCNEAAGGWGCTGCGGTPNKCADGPARTVKPGVMTPSIAPTQGVKK